MELPIVIQELNLSHIEKRLEKKLELNADLIHQCANEYKKFLYLIQSNPKTPIVPSHLVDEIWHEHILHTKQYEKDCLEIFGNFIHHEPSENMEKGEDIEPTLRLYENTFQVKPPEEIWNCANGFCTKCCGNDFFFVFLFLSFFILFLSLPGNKCGKNCKTGMLICFQWIFLLNNLFGQKAAVEVVFDLL
jgi:hypothetical protein